MINKGKDREASNKEAFNPTFREKFDLLRSVSRRRHFHVQRSIA